MTTNLGEPYNKRLKFRRMKKTYKISIMALLALICTLGIFNSCTDQQELLKLPYLFRPINFAATMNSTTVTINWAKVDSAVSYTLEVSNDSVNYSNPVIQLTTTATSYVKELAGNTKFWARLKANAADSLKNSKYNAITFTTPKENIFLGFGTSINTNQLYSAYMTGFDSLDVKWRPNANVTHLIMTATDGTRDSVAISPSELASGEKLVGSLFNSNWKVEVYNGKILRGTTYGIVEGDILLNAGDNLATALSTATAGKVILLRGGLSYELGTGSSTISTNIKLRGLSPKNRPVVSLAAAAPATANMFTLGTSSMSYIKMENIDFTGYCANNNAGTKIQYMFNNGTAATVSNLSFTNCKLRNFGNTTFRLKNGVSQKIDTLSINGCVINDIGFTSTYAIVNSNTNDLFNNVIFANSTIYNFKGSLILRTGSTMNSISISNCNINQGMQDPGSARYLLDLNTAVFPAISSGNNVTIKNCIIGNSSAPSSTIGANGIRYAAGSKVGITGCYYTSDYVDDPIPVGLISTSIKSNMTSYSGASTALWNNPTTGDFSLKDTGFAGKGVAGDLRW